MEQEDGFWCREELVRSCRTAGAMRSAQGATVRVPLYLYLISVTLQSFYIDYRYRDSVTKACLKILLLAFLQDSAHREAIEIFKPCVSMHVFVDLDSASLSSKTDGVTIQQYQRLTNVEFNAIVT